MYLMLIALPYIQLHINGFDAKDVAPLRHECAGHRLCSFFSFSVLLKGTSDDAIVSKGYGIEIDGMSVSAVTTSTDQEALISLPVPVLRSLAMMCVGLFSLWWTQNFMRHLIRMKSFTFVYDLSTNRFWPPKLILAAFTNRFVINVRGVSEVFRNRCSNAIDVHRAGTSGSDFVGDPRYGLSLIRRNGQQALEIDELNEGEALYLAHCLGITYPRICEQQLT